MFYKQLLSAIAIFITFVAYIPYIRSIRLGNTKPHVFSWIIWASVTFIVFLAQLADKGGVGAWPIGVSGIITLYVAILAYIKKASIIITKQDWLYFILAMSSIPFWYFTSNPLWAVVILTTVDLLGFAPTFRKSYYHPYDESLLFFILMAIRNLITLAALENHSLTTILFPTATALACILFVQMVFIRRSIIKKV